MDKGMSFQGFVYEGKPIEDIEQWALDRGEMMIRCIKHEAIVNRLTGEVERKKTEMVMPITFWNTLKYGCNDIGATITFEFLNDYLPTKKRKK